LSVVTKFDGLMFKRGDGRKASMKWNGRFRQCDRRWSDGRIDEEVAPLVSKNE